MSSFQKIIKYIAIAFAALLIFSITSGIISLISYFSNGFSNKLNNNLDKIKISDNYEILDIELNNINILIKEGKKLKIETDSKNINIKEIGNKLLITEKKNSWLPKQPSTDLIIYVPSNYTFKEISIENGAGRLDIDYIKTNELELELGAGKVNINELNVYKESSIDSGAGEIIINSGLVNNLDFDMGIGKVELNLKITGKSEIDSGIGEMKLNLLGSNDDYKINLDKGIGKVKIDNQDVFDSSIYGNGENTINISGGIGNITINYN